MKAKLLISILLLISVSANISMAQQKGRKLISGVVVDAVQHPVAGAIILVDLKKTQVVTDENGFYKIRVKPGAKVLSVVPHSLEVKSDSIGNQDVINFKLEGIDLSSQSRQLEGKPSESIDVGLRSVDSRKGALSVTKSDVIDVSKTDNNMYQNIYQMIQGKVSGVDVSGTKIRIRGQNSFFSGNDPIFVVDGVPVNSIESIMPNTVQSITLLKGTATTMYGSSGSNGVIVITLRKSSHPVK